MGHERKFSGGGIRVEGTSEIAGYASRFDEADGGGDVVAPGAYCDSLARAAAEGRRIKLLWQHDPARVIGVWDEVREDERGLWVRGRLLSEVAQGREAAALVAAGALDGLSIGYSVRRAVRGADGRRRLLEIDLWEVSLVTFPMLASARVGAKARDLRGVARALVDARRRMAAQGAADDRRTA